MSSCPFTNKCDRCNIECEIKGTIKSPFLKNNYEHLCVEGIDIDNWGDEPLERILSKIHETRKTEKTEEIECSKKYRPYCTERIAIYCPSDDTIYYNIDRIQTSIQEMAKENAAIFVNQIKTYRNSWFTQIISGSLVRDAIRETTARAVLHYLLAHERYHWAGGPLNKTPQNEEEALATAWGLYVSFNEEFYRLRKLYHKYSKGLKKELMAALKLDEELSMLYLIELYTFLLTLSRLAFAHFNMPNYSSFRNYIDPFPLSHVPEIYVNSKYVEIRTSLINVYAHADNGNFIGIIVYIDDVLHFLGEVRQRLDPLREVWACCNKQVSNIPSFQTIMTDITALIEEE